MRTQPKVLTATTGAGGTRPAATTRRRRTRDAAAAPSPSRPCALAPHKPSRPGAAPSSSQFEGATPGRDGFCGPRARGGADPEPRDGRGRGQGPPPLLSRSSRCDRTSAVQKHARGATGSCTTSVALMDGQQRCPRRGGRRVAALRRPVLNELTKGRILPLTWASQANDPGPGIRRELILVDGLVLEGERAVGSITAWVVTLEWRRRLPPPHHPKNAQRENDADRRKLPLAMHVRDRSREHPGTRALGHQGIESAKAKPPFSPRSI